MRILKVFSALLSYPDEALMAALPELRAALAADPALSRERVAGLHALIDSLEAGDLLDAQETYVNLFDRVRPLSLNLFEHVHGESRDRGQAMVDLKEMYARGGLTIDADELPDHLPMFLEFLSMQDEDTARGYLGEIAHIAEVLRDRLDKRETPYAAVLGALVDLAPAVPAQPVASADVEQTAAQMDREWAEEPAFDVTGGAACGAARVTPRPAAAAE